VFLSPHSFFDISRLQYHRRHVLDALEGRVAMFASSARPLQRELPLKATHHIVHPPTNAHNKGSSIQLTDCNEQHD